MTAAPSPDPRPALRLPPQVEDRVAALLGEAGRGAEATRALLDLDAALFLWRRMALKGDLPARLIAELGLDLDLSQFSALTAVIRIQLGVGREAAAPATIGLLAEEMNLDPSRASRIASNLIAAGYLRREAAQDDGRKSVLALTPRASSALLAFMDLKWSKLAAVFADWSDEDICAFSRLFARYSDGVAAIFRD